MLVAEKNQYDYLLEEPQYKPKKRVNTYTKVKKQYKSKYITFTIIGFVIALIVLFQYAKLNTINQEIGTLENQLQELNMLNDSINRDVLATNNLEQIERIAIEELGMVKATLDQITLINIQEPQGEEGAYAETNDAEHASKLFGSLSKALDSID